MREVGMSQLRSSSSGNNSSNGQSSGQSDLSKDTGKSSDFVIVTQTEEDRKTSSIMLEQNKPDHVPSFGKTQPKND